MNRKQRRAAKIKRLSRKAVPAGAVERMFDEALGHHHAGRLAKAEQSYRRILAIDPRHAGSLHYLGVIASGHGRYEAAAGLIGAAIGIKDDVPFFHYNLGLTFSRRGQLEEAVASYRRALAERHDFADAHYNLGLALGRQGHLDEASASYRQALALKADYIEAHNNLGTILAKQRKVAEAIASYERALTIRPDYREARHNLGLLLNEQEKAGTAAPRARGASIVRWCAKGCKKFRGILTRRAVGGRSGS